MPTDDERETARLQRRVYAAGSIVVLIVLYAALVLRTLAPGGI